MRTFSPTTESTDTSMSSPIMMLWLDLRVRTSIRVHLPLGLQAIGAIAPCLACKASIVSDARREQRPQVIRASRIGASPRHRSEPAAHALVSRPFMARNHCVRNSTRSDAWVRQGRTDAWVAHQLEVTVQEIEQFKRQNELAGDEAPEGAARRGLPRGDRPARRGRRADRRRARGRAAEAEREAKAEGARPSAEGRSRRQGDEEEAPQARAVARRRAGRGRRSARDDRARSRAPSTTAKRATACGSTPPSRTTRSTPSTGPVTGPSRSLVEEDQIVHPPHRLRRLAPGSRLVRQARPGLALDAQLRAGGRSRPTRVVRGLAQVAREGRVDHDARHPTPRDPLERRPSRAAGTRRCRDS